MVEVEFHNSSTHHSFSLPNHSEYTMATLNEQALVLASERTEDAPRFEREGGREGGREGTQL